MTSPSRYSNFSSMCVKKMRYYWLERRLRKQPHIALVMQTTGSFLMTPLILMKIFTLPFKLFCQVVHSFSDYFVQVSLVNNPAMSRLTHTAICVAMVICHCLLLGASVPSTAAGPADDLSRTGHRARRAIYGHHGFSNEDIRVIMEVHNGRRGQVSPTASNMKYMVSIMGGVGLLS